MVDDVKINAAAQIKRRAGIAGRIVHAEIAGAAARADVDLSRERRPVTADKIADVIHGYIQRAASGQCAGEWLAVTPARRQEQRSGLSGGDVQWVGQPAPARAGASAVAVELYRAADQRDGTTAPRSAVRADVADDRARPDDDAAHHAKGLGDAVARHLKRRRCQWMCLTHTGIEHHLARRQKRKSSGVSGRKEGKRRQIPQHRENHGTGKHHP